jgi:hypothetical protein
MEIVAGPGIEERAERPTLGIRRAVPFRGMLGARDRMLREFTDWLATRSIEPEGPFFLRLHTVDMAGEMDVEVGAVGAVGDADDVVHAGVVPAGDYAVLAYRLQSIQANKLLLGWVADTGRSFAVTPSPDGDRWAGRFENYLTDPRTEARKKLWVTELAFLLRP